MLHRAVHFFSSTRNILTIALLLATGVSLRAQQPAEWSTPLAPFRIIGNIYYVGSQDLAAYLITTPDGDILINGNLPSSPALIQASIEKLGFKMSDIKILLVSHSHFDHVGGIATLKKLTGAKLAVMDSDVSVTKSGGANDFAYANDPSFHFPPAKVDRVLHDGDTVSLGSTVLTAYKTAGHTRGCTTWTLTATENGKQYNVVIIGGTHVNSGYKLVGNTRYPQIADDYARTFITLNALPCDIFLGAHGGYFDLAAKLPRLQPGQPNPFIDPAGYKQYVAEAKADFEAELAKQRAARPAH
jgi:metallo-beta-lactamase class B